MLARVNGETTRVLVVDDEPGVRSALGRGLTAEGMDVSLASDGTEALRLARTGAFDVILLDVLLPGLSGYRVLEQLRASGIETPVLLVSAKDGEFDQADGFDLGADGYVVKPFSFVVLAAQVRAVVRRGEAAGSGGDVLRIGELEIDRGGRKVYWEGSPIALSPREYKLLVALAGRPDKVLGKDDLMREVWGPDHEVTRNVVEVYVGYLRRKLDAVGAGHLVETVRGHGYRMVGE